MYRSKKFRIRPWEELKADILEMAISYRDARRIFLADGDALIVETEYMLTILSLLYETFPRLERVSAYANPSNLLEKSEEELRRIRQAGLHLLYFGIETGDEELLQRIRKGADPEELIASGKKAISAGFLLSATVILGLAGSMGSRRHAIETARVCSAINPQYLSALTLLVEGDARYFINCVGKDWALMEKIDILKELRLMIEHFALQGCIFRSNHASNYLPIKAVLNRDKTRLLREIDGALENPELLRPEYLRAL
jgi:radical SAM superfamily enzyme YgiQ (UPF0313 family)